MPTLRDAYVDLLLGSRCVGCEVGGRALCHGCAATLAITAVPVWPSPAPPGLAPPWACGPYEGLVRDLVVHHKERGVRELAVVLGRLLAHAVAGAVDGAVDGVGDRAGDATPLLLVPVPSRAASVRARGHDPTYAMTRRAARDLAAAGHEVVVARLLRTRPGVRDQAGLGLEARADNLAGSMASRPRVLARLAARHRRARVVVCDDVLTTGSTAREAQRALEAVGLGVLAVATVAATPRRTAPPTVQGRGGEVMAKVQEQVLPPSGASH